MLGLLTTASSVGALIGAVQLASRKNALGLLKRIQQGGAIFGLAILVFGASHWVPLSLIAMAFMGFGMMTGLAGSNTIIQTLSPEEKRGRVMSFYTMAFIGMTPFGSLLAGALASKFGAPHTLLFSGVCVLLAGALFWSQTGAMKVPMRARYEELGILQPKKEAA